MRKAEEEEITDAPTVGVGAGGGVAGSCRSKDKRKVIKQREKEH